MVTDTIKKLKTFNIIFVVTLLLLGVSFIFISNYFTRIDNDDYILERSSYDILEKEKSINLFLKTGIDILYAITDNKFFKSYLAESSDEVSKRELISTFKLVSNINENIISIEYIDFIGTEKIKIEKNNLFYQNKNIPSYLKIAKNANAPFYSSFTVVDGGDTNKTQTPVISAIMPVYVNDTKFKGILVINFDATKLFKIFDESPVYRYVVYDDNGYSMYHYDKSSSWGNSSDHKFNLRDHLTEPELHLNLGHTGIVLHKTHTSKALELFVPIESGINVYAELNNSYSYKNSDRGFYFYVLYLIIFMVIFVLPFMTFKKYMLAYNIIGDMESYSGMLCQEKEQLQTFIRAEVLTGAHNIQKFYEVYNELIIHNLEFDKPFSVIIFHIDDFDVITRKYSFKIVDAILKDVIDNLKTSMRDNQTFMRIGGARFAIFLPNTRLRNSVVFAEKIRSIIEFMDKKHSDVVIDVAISVGVDSFEKNDTDISFLERVQTYVDKSTSTGGNKVTYSSEKYNRLRG